MPAGLTLGAVAGVCALGGAAFGISYATADESGSPAPRSKPSVGTPAAPLDLKLEEVERVGLGQAVRLPAIAPAQRPPAPAVSVAAPVDEPEPEPAAPEPVAPAPPVTPAPAPAPAPDPVPAPAPAPAPDPPPVDFDDSG